MIQIFNEVGGWLLTIDGKGTFMLQPLDQMLSKSSQRKVYMSEHMVLQKVP